MRRAFLPRFDLLALSTLEGMPKISGCETEMKVSLPLDQYLAMDSPEKIKEAICKQLVKFFGTLPTYTVESLGISASDWRVWVRLKVNSDALDYPSRG